MCDMARWKTKYEPWMLPVAKRLFGKGQSILEVAAILGVSRNTLSVWLEEGSQDTCKDDELVEFAMECTKARAERLGDLREVWVEHVQLDAKAAAVEMKACFPDEYDRASVKKVDVTVTQKKVLTDLRSLSAEELAVLEAAEELQARLAERKRLGQ